MKEVTPIKTKPAEDWVDDRKLAVRTPISQITWQVWRSRGKGPPYYKVGRRCLYKWHEVEAWLESKRTEPKVTSEQTEPHERPEPTAARRARHRKAS